MSKPVVAAKTLSQAMTDLRDMLDLVKNSPEEMLPRDPIVYQNGKVILSIQAGYGKYSAPSLGGRSTPLDKYTHVELALMYGKRGRFVRPGALNLPGIGTSLDSWWESIDVPVAVYVPWDVVLMLQAALDLKYGPGEITMIKSNLKEEQSEASGPGGKSGGESGGKRGAGIAVSVRKGHRAEHQPRVATAGTGASGKKGAGGAGKAAPAGAATDGTAVARGLESGGPASKRQPRRRSADQLGDRQQRQQHSRLAGRRTGSTRARRSATRGGGAARSGR